MLHLNTPQPQKTPADVQLACTFCEITLNTTRSRRAVFVFNEGETRTLRNATWSSVGLSWKAPSFYCLLSSVALKGVSENRTLSRMISLWLSRIKCENSPWDERRSCQESQTLLHILTESWRYKLGVRVWKTRTFNRHGGSDERWCIMCCVMGIVGFGFWTLTITSGYKISSILTFVAYSKLMLMLNGWSEDMICNISAFNSL